MQKVDNETKCIYLTRGDTGIVVFGALNEEDEPFHPTAKDRLIFSAARKVGDEPLIEIVHEMTANGSEEEFWTVEIEPHHTSSLEFKSYAYDVQLEIRDSETGEIEITDTIIGKTDTLSPKLVIWGEVSKESR